MKYFTLILTAIGLLNCEPVFQDEGPSHPRLLSDLPQILNSTEGIEELYREFENITGGKRRSWSVAELPQNIKKNRYEDLLAFDHSRVILHPLPNDPYSDYINANYIDGPISEHEYIATQGPLPNTTSDFWRMIVQENVTRIVMLANVIEHGEKKVEKYWPDASETYGDYEITNIKENSIPRIQHVTRTFSIKKPGEEKPQIVQQFHFTGWPDLGVPADRVSIISIITQARLSDSSNTSPIVVHCSAGIGRTGTLILMDSIIVGTIMEGLSDKETVDFPKRLNHMRTLRPDVVEKKEQYLFAYQAVNDFFNDPGTMEKLQEIEEEYENMEN